MTLFTVFHWSTAGFHVPRNCVMVPVKESGTNSGYSCIFMNKSLNVWILFEKNDEISFKSRLHVTSGQGHVTYPILSTANKVD